MVDMQSARWPAPLLQDNVPVITLAIAILVIVFMQGIWESSVTKYELETVTVPF